MVLSAIHFCVQSLHNLSPQSEIPRALNAYFSFHYENLKDPRAFNGSVIVLMSPMRVTSNLAFSFSVPRRLSAATVVGVGSVLSSDSFACLFLTPTSWHLHRPRRGFGVITHDTLLRRSSASREPDNKRGEERISWRE